MRSADERSCTRSLEGPPRQVSEGKGDQLISSSRSSLCPASSVTLAPFVGGTKPSAGSDGSADPLARWCLLRGGGSSARAFDTVEHGLDLIIRPDGAMSGKDVEPMFSVVYDSTVMSDRRATACMDDGDVHGVLDAAVSRP